METIAPSRPSAPQMQISEMVAIALNRLAGAFPSWRRPLHVEEDGASVTKEAESRTGDNQGCDDGSTRSIHSRRRRGSRRGSRVVVAFGQDGCTKPSQ
jgi:hypothetical protein